MDRLIIHPQNPQPRYIEQAVAALEAGVVLVCPTDSGYALVCHLDDKSAVMRIRQLRDLDKHHCFTLLCDSLSEISLYAQVDNAIFRLMRAETPGPNTYVLRATKQVPKRLLHPKRKTIGVRVPADPVLQALLEGMGQALMTVSLVLPGLDEYVLSVDEIAEKLLNTPGLILDAGDRVVSPSHIYDCTSGVCEILR